MADQSKMSVEEILAACRRADGGGATSGGATSGGAAPTPEAAKPEAAAPSKKAPSAPAKPTAAPSGKKPGQMSMEEMLAAARGQTSGGAKAAAEDQPAAKAASPKASTPSSSASAAGKKPGAMTMEEMLAAARAQKAGGGTSAADTLAAESKSAAAALASGAKAAAKPAAKPPAEKSAAQETAKPSGPRDTASILTEARKGDKRGPMTKAEAAAVGKEAPEKSAKAKPVVPPMPEKPAYARAPAPVPGTEQTRRGFVGQLVGVCLGSALAVGFTTVSLTNLLWGLGLARFMFPNILTEPPTRFKVGFPDDFAPGQVQTKFIAQFGVWIVRYEYESQPQIFAIQAVCTHLGCTPNWLEGEQKFKCPCHGSGFYKDGVNFEGPAPRPLERFAIRLADDGQLEVDKSRRFQEELGQWKDTASFVPV